ncbi:MAG: four helix bundle protein [Candidatus Zixiibacteriota bacterium]
MFNFQNLRVWQKSVNLIAELDSLLNDLPRKEQYSLGEQLRRASLSISCNIAEGSGRKSKKEAGYFYNVAKGSVYETVSLMEVIKNKGYINITEHKRIYDTCEEITRMLSGLMK